MSHGSVSGHCRKGSKASMQSKFHRHYAKFKNAVRVLTKMSYAEGIRERLHFHSQWLKGYLCRECDMMLVLTPRPGTQHFLWIKVLSEKRNLHVSSWALFSVSLMQAVIEEKEKQKGRNPQYKFNTVINNISSFLSQGLPVNEKMKYEWKSSIDNQNQNFFLLIFLRNLVITKTE